MAGLGWYPCSRLKSTTRIAGNLEKAVGSCVVKTYWEQCKETDKRVSKVSASPRFDRHLWLCRYEQRAVTVSCG